MTNPNQPSIFSLQLSYTAAVGHINAGLDLYRAFEMQPGLAPGEEIDLNRVIELGVPAVTNLALGIELLVKVHHFQISGIYPYGHDINKLGSTFPKKSLATLRSIYKDIYDNPAADKGLELRYSDAPSENDPGEWNQIDFSTYDLAISYVDPMYVKWRYIYEEFQDKVDICVGYGPLFFLAQTFYRAVNDHNGNIKITFK
jgi:hypothetical protein